MGEVYRARDTRLGRDVALKVLPEAVSDNPGHLARFEREARLLASLDHPHIAAIHGLENPDGAPVLVMELVEGTTLAERLRRGPPALRESLEIARQIAAALEAAHDKGIVHRDLKPSNVMLTPEGRVKLLDFGLAKALEPDTPPAGADSKMSTRTAPTGAGVVLGTAPYMSPEQARGEEMDKRTDVWAWGCVLYELLSGKRAFAGATGPDAIAAVLEREPDWSVLPEATPARVRSLLRRCLRKDKAERLHDIADARIELKELHEELSSGAAQDARAGRGGRAMAGWRRGRVRLVAAAGIVLALSAAIALLVARGRRSRESARQPRFEFTLPVGVRIPDPVHGSAMLAVSPDGRHVAFAGCTVETCQIYVRDRLGIDARPVPGTEAGYTQANWCPFFSPDGRWIGFGAQGKLKKVALDGGTVVTLADAPRLRGGSWGADGTILFSRGNPGGLFRVSAEGGEVRELTRPDPARFERDHRWPQHVPGSHAAVFDIFHEDYEHDVAVVNLETGRSHVVVKEALYPRWSPTGHLLFGRQGVVYAARFDTGRLALRGAPVPVVDGVLMSNTYSGNAYYDIAPEGTLIFSPWEARLPKRTLVSVDRQGQSAVLSKSPQSYSQPKFSPDGRYLAADVDTDAGSMSGFILDIERDAWTRVVQDARESWVEVWMPDGKRLLLGITRERRDHLLLGWVDGREAPVTLHVGEATHTAVVPDGSAILYCSAPAPAQWDIWRLPLDGPRVAEPFLVTPALEAEPSFSSDGHWVAYRSDESGRPQIYARPYPGPGPPRLVSTQGGVSPRWSRDGREIFFYDRNGRAFMSAAVRTSPTFASDPPRKLFDLPEDIVLNFRFYDVTPDGQRFVMVRKDPIELRPVGIVIVPNWTAELK